MGDEGGNKVNIRNWVRTSTTGKVVFGLVALVPIIIVASLIITAVDCIGQGVRQALAPSPTATLMPFATGTPVLPPTAIPTEVVVILMPTATMTPTLPKQDFGQVAGVKVVERTEVGEISSAEMVSGTMPSQEGGAVITTLQKTRNSGQWEVEYFTGATDLMKNFVFTNPTSGWVEFPDTDWPAGGFLAKNGLEYGQELSDFCQDVTCDFPVAARSYRSITADYNIGGIGSCQEGGSGIGCAVMLFNVGDVTASFRDQMVDTGHTITGLYWNGDENDQAVSALASHLMYRMVGIPDSNPANPGANCSVPGGCKRVDLRFAILSGNELLVMGHTLTP